MASYKYGKYIGACFIVFLAVTITTTFITPLEWVLKYRLLRAQFLAVFHVIAFCVARSLWSQVTGSEKSLLTSGLSRTSFLFFLLLAQTSMPLGHFVGGTEPLRITLVAYFCSGAMLFMFFILWTLNFFTSIWDGISSMNQSKISLKLKSIIAISLSLVLCTMGIYFARKGPIVQHVTVPIQGLPMSLNGTRIVQLSDIHLGPTVGRSFLQHIVDMVNELSPDLIVITGDLVDLDVEILKDSVKPLADLKPKYGKFFVTGNHEYLSGNVDRWFEVLLKSGVNSLHNSRVLITHNHHSKDKFYLAGVDDINARFKDHGMNLDQALGGRDSHVPTILLAHQPRAAHKAVLSSYHIDLILSGHTHGGQFFPMHIPIYLYNPYFRGLYHIAEKKYVHLCFIWNSLLGTAIEVRINCRSLGNNINNFITNVPESNEPGEKGGGWNIQAKVLFVR